MSEEIENLSLWKKYKENNNEEARKKLILNYLSLVKYQAGRINMLIPDFIEKQDLESFGVIGLMEAVEKFNPELGIEFKTFAQKRIRGAILDHLRDLDWLPASLRREGKKIKNKVEEMTQKSGYKPSPEEIAEEINISSKKINQIYHKLYSSNWISLYREVGDNNILDLLEGDKKDQPEKKYNRKEALQILTEAIKKLPEKEKLIVTLYYYEELTQKEIASILDLSCARISQMHKKAVQRLRGFLSLKKEELLGV